MYRCLLLLLLMAQASFAKDHKTLTYTGSRFVFKVFVTRGISPENNGYVCGVDSIVIKEKGQPAFTQTIKCEDNGYRCHDTDKPDIVIEDMDFDGTEDIRLRQFLPPSPNIPYYYWLYNAKTKRFEPGRALEAITTPVFDPKRKCITSSWKGSATEYGTTTYEYINEQPVKTEETTKMYSGDYVDIIIKKRVKNKLVVVSKERKKVDEE